MSKKTETKPRPRTGGRYVRKGDKLVRQDKPQTPNPGKSAIAKAEAEKAGAKSDAKESTAGKSGK